MDIPPPPVYAQRRGMPGFMWALIACGCVGAALFAFAILAAILFPVFSQAKEKARQTTCMSNVRMVGLGLRMYSEDWDAMMPPAVRWSDLDRPYVKSELYFHCPSARTPALTPSYAYNSALSSKKVPNQSVIAMTPMLYDSWKDTPNAADPVSSLPSPPRHLGTNVVAFADDHVKAMRSGARLTAEPSALQ